MQAWVFFLHAPRWLVWLREWWAPGQLALHRSYVREFNECAGFVMARGAGAGSQPHGTCGTFLRQALQMQERDELSGAEVQQLVLEMLLAGTDTSSVTMSWLPVAYRVSCRHPQLLAQPLGRGLCAVSSHSKAQGSREDL